MKKITNVLISMVIFIFVVGSIHSETEDDDWIGYDKSGRGLFMGIFIDTLFPYFSFDEYKKGNDDIVDMLLIDPLGRRLGYIKEERKRISEIPAGGCFFEPTIEAYNIEGSDTEPRWFREAELCPVTGKYILNIIGRKGIQIYRVGIRATGEYFKDVLPEQEFKGIISENESQQIVIYYSPSPLIFKSTAIKLVDINMLEKEVNCVIKTKWLPKELGKEVSKIMKVFKNSQDIKDLIKIKILLTEEKKRRENQLKKDPWEWFSSDFRAYKPQYSKDELQRYLHSAVIDVLIQDIEILIGELTK